MPSKEAQSKNYREQLVSEIGQKKGTENRKVDDEEKQKVERRFIDLMDELS